jgi:hypothetical protein
MKQRIKRKYRGISISGSLERRKLSAAKPGICHRLWQRSKSAERPQSLSGVSEGQTLRLPYQRRVARWHQQAAAVASAKNVVNQRIWRHR